MRDNLTVPVPIGISVIVPVYQSKESLVELCGRISNVLSNQDYEIILIDDGSKFETWEVVLNLAHQDERITGIRLSRNYGQHSALLAGIRAASYSITVTIDDDLQNPPEEIPRLLAELLEKQLDIVYGRPERVNDKRTRIIGGRVIRILMKTLLGVEQAEAASSFRAFSTRLRDGFSEDMGPNVSIDAVLSWSSNNVGSVVVSHDVRKNGKSNYSFRKLLNFASDTITGYGIVPLQLATGVGVLAIIFGFGLLMFLGIQRLIVDSPAPGFTLLASIITIFSGIQLMILGLIGEYLGRMHYRIMRKPSYVIRESTSVK